MVVHIGFTGTREVLDERQEKWLKDEMVMLDLHIRLVRLERPVLHHGDCVGGDSFAHSLAQGLGWDIIVHPPLNGAMRGYNQGASRVLRERKYLARDRQLVKWCSTILAIPGRPYDGEKDKSGVRGRSGTWYTVGEAMKAGREVKICAVTV